MHSFQRRCADISSAIAELGETANEKNEQSFETEGHRANRFTPVAANPFHTEAGDAEPAPLRRTAALPAGERNWRASLSAAQEYTSNSRRQPSLRHSLFDENVAFTNSQLT